MTLFWLALVLQDGSDWIAHVRTPVLPSKVPTTGVRTGDPELWIVRHDGTGARRIGALSPTDTPRFTRDGGSILFIAADQIHLADLEGKDVRAVTKSKSKKTCVWPHPDAKSALFLSENQIRLADLATGEERVVAELGEGRRDLELSPAGNGMATFDGDGMAFFDLDGKNKKIVTRGEALRDPVFSPDGSRIAFRRGEELCVAAADGSKVASVKEHVDSHSFAPDGRLVYVHNSANAADGPHMGPNTVLRIATLNEDLTVKEDRRILPSNLSMWDPRVSPDGKRVLFATGGPYLWTLHVVDIDGKGERAVAEDARLGSWAPLRKK
jgi:Tol biopolymer transport system component